MKQIILTIAVLAMAATVQADEWTSIFCAVGGSGIYMDSCYQPTSRAEFDVFAMNPSWYQVYLIDNGYDPDLHYLVDETYTLKELYIERKLSIVDKATCTPIGE